MTNLAVGKMAVQSSTVAPASRATDGSTSTDSDGHSCARTQSQINPSLQVDLAADYEILQIVITNRGDCCGECKITGVTCCHCSQSEHCC